MFGLIGLYLACGGTLIYLCHRRVVVVSLRAAIALIALPLCFVGNAFFSGKVYAPADIALESEPLAAYARGRAFAGTHNPVLTDIAYLMIPWRAAARESLLRGDWPLWNPYVFGGDILAAASEPAPYHPLHLASLLLPLDLSFTFEAAMTILLAAGAAFVFLRELECGEPAAIFGAAAWAFSDFMSFHLLYPMGLAVAVLPAVLLAARRIVRRPGWDSFALLVVSLLLVLLAGHPESTLHIIAIGMIYGLFQIIDGRSAQKGRVLAIVMAAGAVALLLSAVFMLPFVDAISQTAEYQFRRESNPTTATSLPLGQFARRLVVHFLPFLEGDPRQEVPRGWDLRVTAHSGFAGTLLFAPALLALWRHRARERVLFAALALFGWLAAARAPAVTEILSSIPLFEIALNERLAFVGAFSLVVLATLGMQYALSERARREFMIVQVVVIVALGALLLTQWNGAREAGLTLGFLLIEATRAFVPLMLGIAAMLVFASPRMVFGLLLVLQLVTRVGARGDFYPTIGRDLFFPTTPILAQLGDLVRKDSSARIVGEGYTLVPNIASMYQLPDVRGFQGMTLERFAQTVALWSVPQPVWFNRVDDLSNPFLSFLGVRYALSPVTRPIPGEWAAISSDGITQILRNDRALARAFVPRRIRFVPSGSMSALEEMKRQRDFGERAWIEAPSEVSEIENGRAAVEIRGREGRYRLHVVAKTPAWILVSEPRWHGWKLSQGGASVPTVFGNHAFVAFHVPVGESELDLVYLPQSFVAGRAISLITLFLLGLVLLVRTRRATVARMVVTGQGRAG